MEAVILSKEQFNTLTGSIEEIKTKIDNQSKKPQEVFVDNQEFLLLMKISTPAFATVVQQGWWQMVLLLVALDIMVVMLSIILFPFLWKD